MQVAALPVTFESKQQSEMLELGKSVRSQISVFKLTASQIFHVPPVLFSPGI